MSRGPDEELNGTDGNRIVAAIRRNYAAASHKNSNKNWSKWFNRQAGVLAIGIAVVIVAILLPTGYWVYRLRKEMAEVQDGLKHYHIELENEIYRLNEKCHPPTNEGRAEERMHQALKIIDETLIKNMGRVEEIMARQEVAQRSSTTMILERLNEFSQATLSRSQNGARAVEVLAQLLGANPESTKPTFGEWRLTGRN